MNEVERLGSWEMLAARQASKASSAFGAVLSVLGIFAVLAPLFSGIAVTVLVGMLLLASGIIEIVFAFKADSFGKGVLRFLFGGLGILAGLFIIATPAQSLGVLTILLAVFFVAGGIVDIILAVKVRPEEGWGWMLASGIVSIGLGVLIVAKWPVSGIWAVGVYVGIRMLMHGWVLMAVGRTSRDALTLLQDTRIEMLEHHVRAGATALQKTQAMLADHTAMLLAFDNELRKKVSSSEVDPGIVKMNEKLKAAREWMQRADKASTEAWDAAQKEANVAFGQLQHSSSVLAEQLKRELGLGETENKE